MGCEKTERYFCDRCKETKDKDGLYIVKMVIYKEGAVGSIRLVEKEACWNCLNKYYYNICDKINNNE